MKIVVVLLNLGGPSSLLHVKKFLFNLFYDKHIIRLPKILRFIAAKLISTFRHKKAQKIYSLIGGKSTILDQTKLQAKSLEKELKSKGYTPLVLPCMRHFHPVIEDINADIKSFDPERIILLPLYPQYSTTTTLSSIEEILKKIHSDKKIIRKICCYYSNEDFVKAHVEIIKNTNFQNSRLIFSAHSLPQKIINLGDPYKYQIQSSIELIIKNLGIDNIDYIISYQSKLGPIKWLSPNTKDVIEKAGKDGKNVVIIPISFVSEHVETLVELDIEYKEIADKYKIGYYRAPTLQTNKSFIKCLADLVDLSIKKDKNYINSDKCKQNYERCICNLID